MLTSKSVRDCRLKADSPHYIRMVPGKSFPNGGNIEPEHVIVTKRPRLSKSERKRASRHRNK